MNPKDSEVMLSPFREWLAGSWMCLRYAGIRALVLYWAKGVPVEEHEEALRMAEEGFR